jgi:CheY-like chemotaxis protein
MVRLLDKEMDILMVEDNEGDIILTEETLIEGNIRYSLSSVNHGEAAIEFFEKVKRNECKTPDLVLMDFNLPRINGHEVIAYMRTENALKDIPVFIISSSAAPADMEQSKSMVQHYLTKPMELIDFLDGIKKLG